jgi:uncharacterized protein (TIGR02444 family)
MAACLSGIHFARSKDRSSWFMSAFSPSTFPPNELWDFSSRVYAQPSVEAACLALQESHDLDINVLLFCCWVAASGRGELQSGELATALSAVVAWRQSAVLPLRRLRVYLKGDIAPAPRHLADDLRRVAAESELHAEHIEQIMLANTVSRPPAGPFDQDGQAQAAAANLNEYAAVFGGKLTGESRKQMVEILSAAFPAADSAEAATFLKAG